VRPRLGADAGWALRRRVGVRIGCLVALMAVACWPARALAAPEGVWSVGGKVAMQVFDCSGLLCGRIVWLRNPLLRTPQMCGRTILWGLRATAAAQWSGGWFYDPENGHTYNVSASQQAPDLITARIYKGLAFLGRTETLHRITPGSLAGWCGS
jgi:uncharacterized protein (DUF2147 family)